MGITLGEAHATSIECDTLKTTNFDAENMEMSTIQKGSAPILIKGNNDTDNGAVEFKGNFVQAKNVGNFDTELYLNHSGGSVKFGVSATPGTLGSDGRVYSNGLTMGNTQIKRPTGIEP